MAKKRASDPALRLKSSANHFQLRPNRTRQQRVIKLPEIRTPLQRRRHLYGSSGTTEILRES